MEEVVDVRQALLEVRGLTKSFNDVTVLSDVDLDVYGGEIHAIVGANGSGKSTLVKILSGYHQPTSGRVTIVPQAGADRTLKMAFVHQDLGLINSMTVIENVAMTCGYETNRFGRIRWKAMDEEISALLSEFGIDVRASAVIGELGATDRRLVAIVRATHSLGNNRGILVLDEPTAELAPEESYRVFEMASLVAKRGAGVLLICHNLNDALSLSRTVTVLRDGRVIADIDSNSTTVEDLVGYMFGSAAGILKAASQVNSAVAPSSVPAADRDTALVPAIRLTRVFSPRLKDVSLDVWPGEIVGITGLVGCGKSELGRVIVGAQRLTSGTVSVCGDPPTEFDSPHAAVAAGIAYVPADRRRFGGVLSMDARENVTLNTVGSFFKRGWLRKGEELEAVARDMVNVGAVPQDPRQAFGVFSGGNQQKLVFARALRMRPRLAVLDEPTHGVDVSTIPELYRLVREMAKGGPGVVLITSDLEELVALCDRVVVLLDGEIVEELRGGEITVENIGLVVGRGHGGGMR